jgi:hypothetical protein
LAYFGSYSPFFMRPHSRVSRALPRKSLMRIFLPIVLLAAAISAGCGGKKSTTTTTTTVTVAPTTASVVLNQTQQFTATVTNNTNTAVTWQVNGATGGNSVVGTVSVNGLYTAPSTLPNPASVTVTATSQADTTQFASATVTLTAPAVTVTISPVSVTLAAGATQQFTTTVTGDPNTAVTWQVNGIAGGNATFGTVSASGLYTAPLSPPQEAIDVVAMSQASSSATASASVTPQFGNASLTGTYVFFLSQPDKNSGTGFAYRAGAIQADGHGAIAGGISDSNSSASGPAIAIALSGSYSIGADGRGTATLTDASGSKKFSLVLSSSVRGQIISFDSNGSASGYIQQQNQSAIATMSGPFVFAFSGDNAGPLSQVGELTFTPPGTLAGTEDANTAAGLVANAAINGTYTAATTATQGRGAAVLTTSSGTSNFAFYVIDGSTIALVGVDASGPRTAGPAFAQSSGPFTSASLSSAVFSLSGNGASNGGFAEAGRFDANPAGTLTGVFDQNNAGTLTNASAFSGTYSVAANGRGQISAGNSTLVFWLGSQNITVIMNADANAVATGLLLRQQGAAFQSIAGAFGFSEVGLTATGATGLAASGQMSTSGFGVLAGTEDLNNGAAQSTVSIQGALAIGAGGRGTGTVTAGSAVNYDFYFASPNQFVFISADQSQVLAGNAQRQCSDCP